jgi:cardiolipin synthase
MIASTPNLLTLSRIAAVPVLALLFLLPAPTGPWLALAVFVAAGITDYLDGHIARTRQLQSGLGRMLDPIADKLFVAAVIFVLVAAGRVTDVHILPAAIILCREIVVSGLREFLAELRVSLPVSQLSKWKTGVQMVAMGVLLIAPAEPFGLSLDVPGLTLLWAAAALTVVTGFSYLRVGLSHATGRAARGDRAGP